MSAPRTAAAALLAIVLAWMGWLVVQTTRVDLASVSDLQAILRMDPDDPRALYLQAGAQMAKGDDVAAMATARHLLRVKPGEGDAFAVIALAAARRNDPEAGHLLDIAVKRAPRVTPVRALKAAMQIQAGDVAGALVNIDALLRIDPTFGDRFFPGMVQQAADPRFADALAETLGHNPPWRAGLLAQLDKNGTPAALDGLYRRLHARDNLSDVETARWLDRAIAQGRWGTAFAYWVGTLSPAPKRIPPVRDGGFDRQPDGIGFDWRNTPAPGVFTDIVAGAGPDGSGAAHLHFIGRPAPRGNLRQALLLPAGRYRLSLQARGESLSSDQGLQWTIRCDNAGPRIAATEALDGSFGWKRITADFEVPGRGCPGQWLELRNPAVSGSAQQVSGDLWVDDVAIAALPRESRN